MTSINIDQLIKERIEELDIERLARDVLRDMISRELFTEIRQVLRNKADELVEQEIADFLGRPVETNNGWGDRAQYESFEEMFRHVLHKHVGDSYSVKRKAEKYVQEVVSELMKGKEETVSRAIVQMLLKDIGQDDVMEKKQGEMPPF